MIERDYFVEGTKQECEEWADERIKKDPERALIIRKGAKK